MDAQTNERPRTKMSTPPFRADHVGSLLRSPELKKARETLLGPHTADTNLAAHDNAALRDIEDQQIRDAIAMQKRVGLKLATDGELRRRSWMLEMFLGPERDHARIPLPEVANRSGGEGWSAVAVRRALFPGEWRKA
jgi:5-methyltetrahydropteroyltriglutamate--homocysteine methyltransferase